MKKIFTLIIACVAAVAAMAQNAETTTWGLEGSGTAADPYRISKAEDFRTMAQNCTADHKGTGEYFKMTANIDFGGTAESPAQLPAIGKDGNVAITKIAYGFDGTFDGGGFTITGIYHTNNSNNADGKYNGLFGCIDKNGVVKNIVIGNDNHIDSYNYVGTIASLNMGTIENCTNNADVTAAGAFASGICGYMLNGCGTVKNCTNTGNITAMTYAAGICGGSQSDKSLTSYTYLVDNCQNSGNISTTNGVGSAGIAGSYSGAVKNCTNSGTIDDTKGTSKSRQYTAGIVSCTSYASDIDGCTNNGTVNGVKSVGGIVANVMKGDGAEAVVKNCTNNGAVSGTDDYVGGIVANSARDKGKVSVAHCTNNGKVSSTKQTELIGNLRGSETIALGEDNIIAGGLETFKLDPDDATGIDSIDSGVQTTRNGAYLENGRIVIVKDGKRYGTNGIQLK